LNYLFLYLKMTAFESLKRKIDYQDDEYFEEANDGEYEQNGEVENNEEEEEEKLELQETESERANKRVKIVEELGAKMVQVIVIVIV
jgi:hypothetical protein